MYVTNFEFNGHRASEYGLIVCSFNGAEDDTISNGSNIEFQAVNPVGGSKWNFFGAKYTEPLSATFQVMKDPCIYDEDELTVAEISNIMRWLSRTDGYHKFKIVKDGYEDLYYMVQFNVSQVRNGGKCVGLELTATTNAPFARRETNPVKVKLNEPGSITIIDNSDRIGYEYISFEIMVDSACDLVITHNNEETVLIDCSRGEFININGTNMIISCITSAGQDKPVGNRFNYVFPKIENTEETCENVYDFSAACTIKYQYDPIVQVAF